MTQDETSWIVHRRADNFRMDSSLICRGKYRINQSVVLGLYTSDLCLLYRYLHTGVFCDSCWKIPEIFTPQIRYVENSGSTKLDSIVLCQFMANS